MGLRGCSESDKSAVNGAKCNNIFLKGQSSSKASTMRVTKLVGSVI